MRRLFRFCLVLSLIAAAIRAEDSETPRLVLPSTHGEAALHLTVLQDGHLALSATASGQIKLWDTAASIELKTIALGLSGEDKLVALLPRHATQVYAVCTRRIVVLETPSLKILNTIETTAAIYDASVSPDGETLWVSGSTDDKQYIKSLRRGRFPLREVMERKRPPGMRATWGVPAVSPDGRHALIKEAYGQPLVLIRTEDGQIVYTLPEGTKQKDGSTSDAATWTGDGRIIHTLSVGPEGKTNRIALINPDTHQSEWSTDLPIDAYYRTFSPRGYNRPGDPLVLNSLERLLLIDDNRVDGPYVLPNSSFMTAAAIDSRHVLCSVMEGDILGTRTAQLRKFDRARGSFSGGWSPPVHDNKLIVGSSRGDTLFVSDNAKSAKVVQLDRGGLRITNVTLPGCFDAVFTPNGREVIFRHGEHDSRISGVIDVDRPGQPRISKLPFDSYSRGVWGNTVLSPSGKLMVDIRNGSTPLEIYDPYTGRVQRTLPNGYYSYDQMSGCVAFSPDDRRIVYFTSEKANEGRSVNCYDVTTGAKLWTRGGFANDFSTFRYSDDGKQIFAVRISTSSPRLYVFDAETGVTIREHELPEAHATQAIFNPEGTEIALPAGDSVIFVSVADGKELRRGVDPSQRAERLSYLGSNRLASTGSDNAIRLWNTASGALLGTISFSRDGREWAFIHPFGRFEATAGFQEQMYFVQKAAKIPLTAYFESYHTPGLIGQIMAGESIAAPTIQLKDLTAPPTVVLELAGSTRNLTVEDAPQEVTSEQATLKISAHSADSKIAEIRLYQNGKLVQSRTRNLTVEDDTPDVELGKGGRTESITVTLLPGENTFRAVALNEQRTESAPALLSLDYKAPQAALAGRDGGGVQLHLLVIGVNTYRNPKYNLNYAVPDATAVRDLVQKNSAGIFTKVNVTTFFNEKATRSAILDSFTSIAQQSGPRDVFVFYFAGHGVMSSDSKSEFFLAPHELTQLYGADDQLRIKAISSAELLSASQKISAQKQLFLLDACQSAGALQAVAARGASEEKAVAQLARASGTHWITASGSEQFATEFEKLGHGTFTYALREALGGKADNGDGRVTVNELKAYLETQVPELTKLHKGTPQYPASYGFGQDFPLSVILKK